ncbi:ATP-binding protein [Streptomyces sp. NPDC057301]|uniref:ATP-binding protein n=1 Tax=Streptomyces sp. NPDC057301 TaxID=3346093 RepID=UPI003639016E
MLRQWIAGLLTGREARLIGDDLALLATEIASNAVRHGSTPVYASLSLTDSGLVRVRLEVLDSGTGFDRTTVLLAGDETIADHGRGLRIVDALAHSWGNALLDHGHLVWAEMTAAPD